MILAWDCPFISYIYPAYSLRVKKPCQNYFLLQDYNPWKIYYILYDKMYLYLPKSHMKPS